jgi:N-acetylglucosamine kinase-like BadF-type ATPase
MALVLGIDGGGSKSTAAISDGLSVLSTHTAGGSNLNWASKEDVRFALSEAVRGALFAAGVGAPMIGSVCAGLAGASSPEHARLISEVLAELLPHSAIQVVGDNVIALESAFPGAAGMVCIAGSGSVAFGRNERGEYARAGGWGGLVSDEGSGFWIGRRAVSLCLRALDMGRSTNLIPLIMSHWQIATREQLVQHCRHEEAANFADLFPVVLAVADGGDAMANEILTVAGIELARIAQVVLRRLWVGRSRVEIALAGGVFTASARVRHVFANIVRFDRPEVSIRMSSHSPVRGALYLAQRALGTSESDSAVG